MKHIIPFVLVLILSYSPSQTDISDIEVQIFAKTKREHKTKELLIAFLKKYDLTPYLFTRIIIIKSRVLSHSHPVLTINTKHNDDPDRLLSVFLHEQIHWFAFERKRYTFFAIREFKKIYPNIPVGHPEGARTEYSSYLHLVVCYLQLQALKRYLGEKRAYSIIETNDHYKWIYSTVIKDEKKIESILRKYNLLIEKNYLKAKSQLLSFTLTTCNLASISKLDKPISGSTWRPTTTHNLIHTVVHLLD